MSTTSLTVLSEADVFRRCESGLLVPMHGGDGLRVVDCGDDRPLTSEYETMINSIKFNQCIDPALFHIDIDHTNNQESVSLLPEVSPGRIYGGVDGIALIALTHIVANTGVRGIDNFIRNHGIEAFVDFAADISDRAAKLSPEDRMILNHHSAHGNEGNPKNLNKSPCEDPVGCAFAHGIGRILHTSYSEDILSEAKLITSVIYTSLPVDDAASSIRGLASVLGQDLSIHRGAILYAQKNLQKFVPVAMHEGHHVENSKTALVIDFEGYRANARKAANQYMPRYHHTLTLPQEVLSKVMPEGEFNNDLLQAITLLFGIATRRALSGEQTPHALGVEIIPPKGLALAA